MDKVLYIVYLDNIPISVHKWPWAAIQEAQERTVNGKNASVVVFNRGGGHTHPQEPIPAPIPTAMVPVSDGEFASEEPTYPEDYRDPYAGAY